MAGVIFLPRPDIQDRHAAFLDPFQKGLGIHRFNLSLIRQKVFGDSPDIRQLRFRQKAEG